MSPVFGELEQSPQLGTHTGGVTQRESAVTVNTRGFIGEMACDGATDVSE